MATPKSQRIAILFIAGLMFVSTIGMFAMMVLAQENSKQDQQKIDEATAQYQSDLEAYQKKKDAQTAALSKKYYATFSSYAGKVGKFDVDSVSKLTKTDLRVGTGDTIKADTEFAAYYIGWNPDGKIFDQSIDGKSLKTPLVVTGGVKQFGLIEGWQEGVIGMKIGGVRLIEIPSDKAYGEQGSGDDIPPNTPIKFIVMAIPTPEAIEEPAVPDVLLQQYTQGLGL